MYGFLRNWYNQVTEKVEVLYAAQIPLQAKAIRLGYLTDKNEVTDAGWKFVATYEKDHPGTC